MPPRFVKARVKGNAVTKYEMKGAFYQYLKIILKLCRYLGFLPISGMLHSTGEFSSLKWKTPYTLIYVPAMALQAAITAVFTYDYILTDYKIRKLVGLLFFITSFLGSLSLLSFSKKWKNLLKEIEYIEKLLPPNLNVTKNICFSNCIMGTILALGVLEYMIYVVYTISLVGHCDTKYSEEPNKPYVKNYFMLLYPWVYKHVNFSYAYGFTILLSELQLSFVWNAVDSLIIVICIYLANIFKTYNQLIVQKQLNLFSRISTPSWSELQVYYTRMSRLVRIIDDTINPLIFISFSSNLISICQQLFYILNKLTRNYILEINSCKSNKSLDWKTTFCIVYTFAFIVARTMLVSFFGAEVHTLSREPLNAFNVVPSSGYNEHMKRLMTQVFHSRVHLSGLNFFHITRGMILIMVGTLMTYELVLLQI